MTNAKTTTRPSENLLTRRKMLQSMTATGVAVALPTGVAAAQTAVPTHPWERASRLARELSNVLGEIQGGRWFAEVRAPNANGCEVFFGDAEAIEEAKAMAIAEDAELVALGVEYEGLLSANRQILEEMRAPHNFWLDEIRRRNLDWTANRADIAALEQEAGLTPLQSLNNAYCDRMGEIEHRARHLQATTFGGVRAKFTIAHGCLGPSYADVGSREDQDWDVELLNEFADELKRLASI